MPPPSPAMLRKAAHYRLAERLDPAKNRHKPLSLVRAEARRAVDLFLEREAVLMSKAERDRLAEDVVAESIGCGPLEELFRDAAVSEVQILPGGAVVALKGGQWQPVAGKFRDDAQVRAALAHYAEAGVADGAACAGSLLFKLPNGWRLAAVVPPAGLEYGATANLVREGSAPATPQSASLSGTLRVAPQVAAAPSTSGPGSSILHGVLGGDDGSAARSGPASGSFPRPAGLTKDPRSSGPLLRGDDRGRVRQRVTERLIQQLAAAGVYDVKRIPMHELRKIVSAYVVEQCQLDGAPLDETAREEVTVEILTAMSR